LWPKECFSFFFGNSFQRNKDGCDALFIVGMLGMEKIKIFNIE